MLAGSSVESWVRSKVGSAGGLGVGVAVGGGDAAIGLADVGAGLPWATGSEPVDVVPRTTRTTPVRTASSTSATTRRHVRDRPRRGAVSILFLVLVTVPRCRSLVRLRPPDGRPLY